jgi:hypothetical protein
VRLKALDMDTRGTKAQLLERLEAATRWMETTPAAAAAACLGDAGAAQVAGEVGASAAAEAMEEEKAVHTATTPSPLAPPQSGTAAAAVGVGTVKRKVRGEGVAAAPAKKRVTRQRARGVTQEQQQQMEEGMISGEGATGEPASGAGDADASISSGRGELLLPFEAAGGGQRPGSSKSQKAGSRRSPAASGGSAGAADLIDLSGDEDVVDRAEHWQNEQFSGEAGGGSGRCTDCWLGGLFSTHLCLSTSNDKEKDKRKTR